MTQLQFSLPQASIPYCAEWLGLWSMQERAFDALLTMVATMDLGAHLARQQELAAAGESRGMGYRTDREGVAIVQLRGTLQKQAASLSASTSTVMARRDIRAAASDPAIGAIMVLLDSPGGVVSGTAELAADLRDAAASKPTFAYIEDLCCSAAYWVASQAQSISANEMALVGSVGTYAIVADSSAKAEKDGLRVHVVKSQGSTFKGAGVPGSAVSPEHLAEFQSIVNSRQEYFSNAVAAGRKLSRTQVDALATGQVWPSSTAISNKLIDKVQSFDAAFAEARAAAVANRAQRGNSRGANSMSTDNPVRAYNAAIDAEMAAQSCDRQTAAYRIRRRHPEMATAVRDFANSHQATQPQPSQAGENPNPYWSKVAELQRTQGISRGAAQKLVNSKHPELREHARV